MFAGCVLTNIRKRGTNISEEARNNAADAGTQHIASCTVLTLRMDNGNC